MLYVYLVTTIIGGSLLVASVVTGGHHGGGGGHLHQLSDGHSHPGHGGSIASLLFSVRLWTYFLAFGGLTGLLLHFVGSFGEVFDALVAAGVGLTSGVIAQTVVAKMGSLEMSGGTLKQDELVGKTGQLLLPVARGLSGKVRLTVKNHAVDLIATSDDPAELPAREEVLVVEVKDGVALVTRNPALGRKT